MPGLVYGRYRVQDLECGYIALYSALIIIVYYLTNKLTWDRNSAIINIRIHRMHYVNAKMKGERYEGL